MREAFLFCLFIPFFRNIHLFDAQVAAGIFEYLYKNFLGFCGIHNANFRIAEFTEAHSAQLNKSLIKVYKLL